MASTNTERDLRRVMIRKRCKNRGESHLDDPEYRNLSKPNVMTREMEIRRYLDHLRMTWCTSIKDDAIADTVFEHEDAWALLMALQQNNEKILRCDRTVVEYIAEFLNLKARLPVGTAENERARVIVAFLHGLEDPVKQILKDEQKREPNRTFEEVVERAKQREVEIIADNDDWTWENWYAQKVQWCPSNLSARYRDTVAPEKARRWEKPDRGSRDTRRSYDRDSSRGHDPGRDASSKLSGRSAATGDDRDAAGRPK